MTAALEQVFKWRLKKQYQSNRSDQWEQEKTARWTNQNSKQLFVQGVIGFASQWLKSWREIFEPISRRNNHDRVITFDSPLKTALNQEVFILFVYTGENRKCGLLWAFLKGF